MLQSGGRRKPRNKRHDIPHYKGNKIGIALSKWLEDLPDRTLITFNVKDVFESFPKSYTIYEPMLLLPSTAFTTTGWQELVPLLSQERLNDLYVDLVSSFGLSHLAVNAPIPLQHMNTEISKSEYNVLRLPSSIRPLYGDFGPLLSCTESPPTAEDFVSAFWVTARQNGIVQIWAPLHTMFSRGNISEKSRILSMPSVAETVQQGRENGKKCTVVDLYAGIGYFAFSYTKAGVGLCLCWEISGWSVEGLRRGAQANKWKAQVVASEESDTEVAVESDEVRLLVFQESNEYATQRIRKLRHTIPPVRHVNCGLLPSSDRSWQTALEVLDPVEGGWLHLHENIAIKDLEERAKGVLDEVKILAKRTWNQENKSDHGNSAEVLELQNIEQVKTYAPGVMHCVLDIFVSSTPLS